MRINFWAILTLFLVLYVNAQEESIHYKESGVSENLELNKIEDYILTKQLDSAQISISVFEKFEVNDYLSTLKRICSKNDASYSDYYAFASRLGSRPKVDYQSVSNFIDINVKVPNSTEKMDYDYVLLRWLQISKLRDETTIDEASVVQSHLEKYLDDFGPSDENFKRAHILSSTHQIVLYTIQKDIKKAKALCMENLEISEKLRDPFLQISSLYHLCDLLVEEGKLEEYIETSEYSLELEKELSAKSPYYLGTLIHLINAYIFKGGNDERVVNLLDELYEDSDTRVHTYSLYAQYVTMLDEKSQILDAIYKKFQVKNLLEFCERIESLSKNRLNPNDMYHVLAESAKALERNGLLKEAIAYKNKSLLLTRKIYSQDLSKSLANFQTKQAIIEKELEVTHAKERTTLYIVIASLIGALFVASILIIIRNRKQNRTLNVKNGMIEKSLNEKEKLLKEKELLFKEMHHRVKNNFQVVSSLLELQTKGVEDKMALALAMEGQNRVKSMAFIHQKLYENEDLLIAFDEYVKKLVDEISKMYGKSPIINLNIPSYKFDVDTAIPLGLIVNEIITNAYKYGFDKKNPKLDISIDTEDKEIYVLAIKDNGDGLPINFDFSKAQSLGLKLVRGLSKQLHGKTTYSNLQGCSFSITFKDTWARMAVE